MSSTQNSGMQTYRRLLTYLKPLTGLFILSIIGNLIFASTQPALAKMMEVLVDAIEAKDIEARYYIPAALLGIYLVRGIGLFIGGYYMANVAQRIVNTLRTELFAHMLVLPTSFYDGHDSGHLMAKVLNYPTQVIHAVTSSLTVLFREGFMVIALLAYVLWMNWQLTALFLCVAPVIGLVVAKSSKRFRRMSSKIQDSIGDIAHVCAESINGHRVIRTFNGEQYEQQRFEQVCDESLRRQMKLAKTDAWVVPLLQFLVVMAMAAIIFLILQPQFLNAMSTGEYVAYVGAIGLLPKSIRQLSQINAKLQQGIAAAQAIFEVIDLPAEVDQGTHRIERARGALSATDLRFRYSSSDQDVLKGINLEIPAGQTVALVGRSGSGKSTLANLIPRFYEPTAGSLQLDGVDLQHYSLASLRKQVAVVNQQVTLFHDSIAANIAYGSEIDPERLREVARQAHADEFIEQLPQGYDTLIGENGANLSGGQRQRLAIARALYKDAPILILDEATSALDNESEKHIQAALEAVMKNRTTLVIAHRLSTIEKADCILVMDKGEIKERGNHQALLAQGGMYAALYRSGFDELG